MLTPIEIEQIKSKTNNEILPPIESEIERRRQSDIGIEIVADQIQIVADRNERKRENG